MGVVWCPYTGKEWDSTETNEEHIIPLSLCGANEFTIPVNSDINHKLGTELDQAFAENEIVSFARSYYRCQGHRKRDVTVKLFSEIDGWRGKVHFTKENIKFMGWGEREAFGLNAAIALEKGSAVKSLFMIDENLFLSFGAKIALSSAAYLYGQVFEKYGYHDELRLLLDKNNSLKKLKGMVVSQSLSKTKAQSFWGLPWPRSVRSKETNELWMNAVNSRQDRHTIWTFYTASEVILFVSLFSTFLWIFKIGSRPDKFNSFKNDDLGYVLEICLSEGRHKLCEYDLRSYLREMENELVDR